MLDIKELKLGAKRDLVDLRDYIYEPRLGALPTEHLPPPAMFRDDDPGMPSFGVRNQANRMNCIGQAMATLIDIQRHLRDDLRTGLTSAAMLYQMAKFYDMPDQDPTADDKPEGIRSLRSAFKAFFHHGACLGDGPDGWHDDDLTSEWPNDAQASAAEGLTLGAYSRLQPTLHHYHCAIVEAGAVIVTALVHDGWKYPENGVIQPAKQDPNNSAKDYHAFVIIGYNKQGFLVQNSWGPDWGNFGLGPQNTPARGMAIWTYADWAKSIVDGWVLRLGVPGHDAFVVGAGEQGITRTAEAETQNRTPYRMLRGHFLNLDAGRLQETGPYATPEAAMQSSVDGLIGRLRDGTTKGIALYLPGVMDSESRTFEHAVRLKLRFATQGLDFLTCLWSSNFAAEMNALLRDIFERCRQRSGNSTESLDRLFEETARGAGRAFWREIERHAYCAALKCDDSSGLPEDRRSCGQAPRGKLGDVVLALAQVCLETGKPLHILANGAGALVLDGLLERARAEAATRLQLRPDKTDPLDWIPALGAVALSFPAVPLDRANDRILPLANAMVRHQPRRAQIFVPTLELEGRLSVHGYGKSILQLVSRSFMDRYEPGQPRRAMLGSYDALGLSRDNGPKHPEDYPPFYVFSPSRAFRLNQSELDSDPQLETLMIEPILNYSPRNPQPMPQSARLFPPPQEQQMNMIDTPRITLSQLQAKIGDGSLTADESRAYFRVDAEASTPFSPVLVVNEELVQMPRDGARSALALNSANYAARWLRLGEYYKKIGNGYNGPRIAAEGDSWFQYPVRLFDVIDYVARDHAVYDTSAAGDLLENIAKRREYITALKQSDADILLLSAGGNDVCAGGALAQHLEEFDPDLAPADYLKRSYQTLMDNAIAFYERICRDVNTNFPGVTIVTHGYDYVIPNDGRWLGKPMASRGITDRDLQRRIAAEMIDQFNRALRRMAATMSHVAYVDCRNAVQSHQWFDELHPDNGGFANVASLFLTRIRDIVTKSRAQDRMLQQIGVPNGPKVWTKQKTSQSLDGQPTFARSLHIGLNAFDPAHYAGSTGTLFGCENDARAMRELAEAQGYATTMLLTRDATRGAVIQELERAARDLRAGDQFLFTNACHGGQISDMNGDELNSGNNNLDSTMCLYDSQMIDDELWSIFAKFNAGVRIVMVADSCHSGSLARKAMTMNALLMPKTDALPAGGVLIASPGRERCISRDLARQVEELNHDFYAELARTLPQVSPETLRSPVKSIIKASVIQFSACRDEESAMDGDENGVFTSALLRVWNRGRFGGSYDDLKRAIQQEMTGAQQRPGLFTPEPVDPAFLKQRAFTIAGARLNQEAEGIRMNGTAQNDVQVQSNSCSDAGRMADSALMLVDDVEDTDSDAAAMRGHERALSVPPQVVARFRDFLAPLRLQHFDATEFLALGGSNFSGGPAHGLNTAPPETLWPNIVPTAKILDQLRARLGVAIKINSAYRSPAYNQAIGGAGASWHMQFLACDITASGVSPRKVADTLTQMRREGMFIGGIGRYPGFTHVDTRGVNVDWGSNGSRGGAQAGDSARLVREFASAIPQPRASREVHRGTVDDLSNASAAVNGQQLLALSPAMSNELRRAVLYSTQFAQRAANASADPVKNRLAWWATHNAALGAVGWVTKDAVVHEASSSEAEATLDALALKAMASVVGVSQLAAISAVLNSLREAAENDDRLQLLDLQVTRSTGGALQIGDASLAPDGAVSLATGAVQFAMADRRKRVLFARWGGASESVWVAAERLVFNYEFYRETAQQIVEDRLTDAQNQILAFAIEKSPAKMH